MKTMTLTEVLDMIRNGEEPSEDFILLAPAPSGSCTLPDFVGPGGTLDAECGRCGHMLGEHAPAETD